MFAVEVDRVAKAFGNVQAVADTSFTVAPGEIFGLLGPNGAGKTTIIRMMLDIFKPDRGRISVLGGAMDEAKKDRLGYLPEERGLYLDIPLERCLLYLASLKGIPNRQARRSLDEYLERFNLTAHKHKKVKELSKGMQQKAQLINALLHQPELIVIDEPFAALDPVNVQLVKDVLREVRARGAAIIMSTHQMHQVEELCDRLLLINQGKDVLYGKLSEVRSRFYGHAVLIRSDGDLPELPGVIEISPCTDGVRLTLAADTTPQDVLRALVAQGMAIERFEVAVPSLEEIFIRLVGENEHE